MTGPEKRHSIRRQTSDRRANYDAAGGDAPQARLASSFSAQEGAICPKCGSARTLITAQLNEESQYLTVIRCEVCASRFTRLGSAAS